MASDADSCWFSGFAPRGCYPSIACVTMHDLGNICYYSMEDGMERGEGARCLGEMR